MPQPAHVSSFDAIESFRSSLIVYLSQARPALEEVSANVLRTRLWLENDQCAYWENQLRCRAKELDEAQQALFSARLGTLRHETALDQMAVHRAKRAVDEAEAKLRIIKRWRREFDGRVQPLVKQMEKLQTVFSNDMVKAVAYLTQTLSLLAAYAESHAPAAEGAPTPAPPSPAGAAQPAGQGRGQPTGAGGLPSAEGAEAKR